MLFGHILHSKVSSFSLQCVIESERLNHTLWGAAALPHEEKSEPKTNEAALHLAQQDEFLVTDAGTVPEHKHM